jgi:hypothetical protein
MGVAGRVPPPRRCAESETTINPEISNLFVERMASLLFLQQPTSCFCSVHSVCPSLFIEPTSLFRPHVMSRPRASCTFRALGKKSSLRCRTSAKPGK